MQLPNKLYSYKNSTLALLPVVINEIKGQPILASELYRRVKPALKDATDFLSVMDCLYALQMVDITEEGEVFIC